jgi:cytochrome c biogenesis protein CcdA
MLWQELVEAFALGSSAILTNVCLLPLYPGLMAFLAGSAGSERARRSVGWLGLLVLMGVLSMMLIIGLLLSLARASFGQLLPVLLPAIYAAVIALGVLMLLGRNPFTRMATAQAPILNNPPLTAYVYGLLLGPMTLPCTGPIITAAFLRGAAGADVFAGEMLYFLAFGFGFGWPLVVLPWIALPAQRRITAWLTRHHLALTRAAGLLLIAIGIFGITTEVIPNLTA